jgi:coenzyme Q-binding protein COQ10
VCDVTLSIQYKFRNPVYDMMSKAVAPKMADKMVEAFEKRVRKLLD